MTDQPKTIEGSSFSDHRGTIHFVNDFNMTAIKRFYCIDHHDQTVIRAWRGHKIEQRWFHVITGVFKVKIVKIDNWLTPDPQSEQITLVLKAVEESVLHVPVGYATGLQAMESGSKVVVFSDYGIENAENDNHLFPVDYFGKWEE